MARPSRVILLAFCGGFAACSNSLDLYGSGTDNPGSDGGAGNGGAGDGGSVITLPLGSCLSHEDCAADQRCAIHQGCIPRQCSLPPDENGEEQLRQLCDPRPDRPNRGCAAGLVCVATIVELDYSVVTQTLDYRIVRDGWCQLACDPCAEDECTGGETCVALSTGGGFCLASKLQGEVMRCNGVDQICAAGLSCERIGENSQCVRICVPEVEPTLWADTLFNSIFAARPSADCAVGDVCYGVHRHTDTAPWRCIPGELVRAEGASCDWAPGLAAHGGRYCEFPLQCGWREPTAMINPIPVCTSRGGCEDGCPAEAPCATLPRNDQASAEVCIADGAITRGYPCATDADCATGLACTTIVDHPSDFARFCL